MNEKTDPNATPPEGLAKLVHEILDEMCTEYEEAHKLNGRADPVPPRIVAVSPSLRTSNCPRQTALGAFSNPKTKAIIPAFCRTMIEHSNGAVYAVMVASEAWQKILSEEEFEENRGRVASDYEDAIDTILVTVYTLTEQLFWSQPMKGGVRDGEPVAFRPAKTDGNLAMQQP